MKNIVINRQGFASRCEVCHKNDRFDATTNFCSRCQNANLLTTPSYFSHAISSHVGTAKMRKEIEWQKQLEPQSLKDRIIATEGTPIYATLFMLILVLLVNHQPNLSIKLVMVSPFIVSFVLSCVWTIYLKRLKR